jgi:hypothetical protein
MGSLCVTTPTAKQSEHVNSRVSSIIASCDIFAAADNAKHTRDPMIKFYFNLAPNPAKVALFPTKYFLPLSCPSTNPKNLWMSANTLTVSISLPSLAIATAATAASKSHVVMSSH